MRKVVGFVVTSIRLQDKSAYRMDCLIDTTVDT